MPRDVLEFRIVVASPSDVYDARKAVFEGLDELNRIFETQKISIKALGWEEYVTPGTGTETQDVINKQLLVEYDILIAIFGTKLGTPTRGYPSGTVEEIEHAIENKTSPFNQSRVQIYFLDKIDSASSISIDDLKQVADFRKELEPRGIFYRLFKNDDELQREVRINIQRSILEYLSGSPRSPSIPAPTPQSDGAPAKETNPPHSAQEEIADAGILDIQETAEEAIQAAGAAVLRINELISEITTGINVQTTEIEKFSNSTTKDKKRTINQFAAFIEERAVSIKREASLARGNFDLFSQNVVSLAALQRQTTDSNQYKQDLALLLETVEQMLQSLPEIRTSIDGFKTAVENLPKITIQFNRSKKLLLQALDECTQFFDETERGIYKIAGLT